LTHFSVLYDGWPLIYQPNSPEALHLLAILSCHLEGVQALLALPAEPPSWLSLEATIHVVATANTARNRLNWEQRTLPVLRRRTGAALLHLTSPNPPLFGPEVNLVSPSSFDDSPPKGRFASRLRKAISQGGMARLGGLLWPDDLPLHERQEAIYRLQPAILPGFLESNSASEDDGLAAMLDLPAAYVLYHGPSYEGILRRLLAAWSWAVEPVGDGYPLLAIGLGADGRERLAVLTSEYGLGETVRSLAELEPGALGAVYRRSAALFQPVVDPPWGGPVRLALASGTPVVSIEGERMDALVGPAAYLVGGQDARALGAAVITVLVEEGVAQRLTEAGRQRVATWSLSAFAQGLANAYRDILDKRE